ncbi:YitT family ABC transporter [Spiroplasma taiwanense]|uniref:YitT family protein n=1 Tax=Spiroplasma taiwanense CT-1 TaxID=1276220 RepID=S5MGT1_9MOLU|nr:YitT family ABC transporter [Spiroplasma taiwanense]AGR41055.1 hypothetical protein STAIW_v1c04050 [Spiroplasma taiwanense CT-1]
METKDLVNKQLADELETTLEAVEEYNDEFYSSDEKKAIKKKAKELSRNHTEYLNTIENKLLSKREQTLLVQEYFKTKFLKELRNVALAALFITIAFDYFITTTGRSGLFPAGLGALARFFAILTFPDDSQLQSSFYFIYYFALNVPLIIFGYIKLGKKFTFITLLFIILQIGFDQIIQNLPVINPTDFHIIINYKLLQQMPNSWNISIWLFIFGSLGGLLLGSSYSLVYKIGSSTGGLDFMTIYYSKIKNKPIGSINRNVNLIILATVITLNTIILPAGLINSDIKINVLNNLGVDNAYKHFLSDGKSIVQSMWDFAANDAKYDGNWALWFKDQTDWNNLSKEQYEFLVQFVSQRGYGDDLSLNIIVKMKFMFLFGPSLFASIVLVLCSSVATNFFYPKYKVRTYLITTNHPKEVNSLLLENGFQNDILTWDGTNRVNGNYLHRSLIMVAMSVMDWDKLEKQLFLADPQAKINIIKTKSVKGLFNYEIKKNDDRDIIHDKISSDEMELEKIRQIAIVRFNKENEKLTKKIKRKIKTPSKSNE